MEGECLKNAVDAGTIYYSLPGPKLLGINGTGVRRELGVQCVIILMKYRFGTIKEHTSVAKMAHFFTAKQSHPFNGKKIDSRL